MCHPLDVLKSALKRNTALIGLLNSKIPSTFQFDDELWTNIFSNVNTVLKRENSVTVLSCIHPTSKNRKGGTVIPIHKAPELPTHTTLVVCKQALDAKRRGRNRI